MNSLHNPIILYSITIVMATTMDNKNDVKVTLQQVHDEENEMIKLLIQLAEEGNGDTLESNYRIMKKERGQTINDMCDEE
jgi:hypothetical protein